MTTANPEFNLTNVQEEIHNWVVNYLDVPSDHYSGHKPCPFAKKAWVQDKCLVMLGGEKELTDAILSWDDSYEIIAFAVSEDGSSGLEEYCDQTNEELVERNIDLVLLPFIAGDEDPDDPDLEPDHWGKLLDEAYSLVFVQRLSVVNKTSEVLQQMGYYDKVSPEFFQYVKERRGL